MGDFNFVVDSTLDRKNKKTHTRKGLPLFKQLEKQDFKDTFRLLHPDDQEFTWSGRDIATRIDYIWVSKILS